MTDKSTEERLARLSALFAAERREADALRIERDELKARLLVDKTTEAISQKQHQAMEAFCAALIREKGPRSALDYELCQQLREDGLRVKWWFQLREEK